MSGIVGSKLNIRGSGLVGSLGTDGQHLLSSGPGVSNVFETAAGGGKIGQVLNVIKTDTFSSTTSDDWHDITDMTLAITPAATSSKILWSFCLNGSTGSLYWCQIVYGDGSALTTNTIGDAASARTQSTSPNLLCHHGAAQTSPTITGLDAPNTTNATTYKLVLWGTGAAFYVNRGETDTDNNNYGRCVSTLTLMEVLA